MKILVSFMYSWLQKLYIELYIELYNLSFKWSSRYLFVQYKIIVDTMQDKLGEIYESSRYRLARSRRAQDLK